MFCMIVGIFCIMVLVVMGGIFFLFIVFMLGGFILFCFEIYFWWIWGYWIFFFNYVQSVLCINEFLVLCWSRIVNGIMQIFGELIFVDRGMIVYNYYYWVLVVVLVVIIFIFNILYIVIFLYLSCKFIVYYVFFFIFVLYFWFRSFQNQFC